MNVDYERKVHVQSCLDLADQDGLITLTYTDSASLEANEFWQNDQYDCRPEDLTVTFSAKDVELAIKVLNEHHDISSLHFEANINSNNFGGKLRGDELHVTRYSLCGEFRNDWTGTNYQIPLDSMLNALRTANTPADQ